MKRFLFGAAISALIVLQALAFEIPQGTHNLAEIEKAQTTAIAKSRPLVFIISVKTMKET